MEEVIWLKGKEAIKKKIPRETLRQNGYRKKHRNCSVVRKTETQQRKPRGN
jgi:hypothetical protein